MCTCRLDYSTPLTLRRTGFPPTDAGAKTQLEGFHDRRGANLTYGVQAFMCALFVAAREHLEVIAREIDVGQGISFSC